MKWKEETVPPTWPTLWDAHHSFREDRSESIMVSENSDIEENSQATEESSSPSEKAADT